MATRAQRFRYAEQRSKPPLPKKVRKVRVNVGTKRARGAENGTMHEHLGAKGGSKATVVIEETLSGHSSRKTTRASANKMKTSNVLEQALKMKSTMPSVRHGRRGG